MMYLSTVPVSVADFGILALVGYAVVFFGIILLMLVVSGMGKVFSAIDRKKAAKAVQPATPVQEEPKAVAPGSAGHLNLHNTDPKTAAMLMAIVADKMGKPLNELHFISIKEVE